MDATDDESVQHAIDAILQREGRLDIVVNNAGIAIAGPLELTSIEEAKRQSDVNRYGAFRVCRAVLPRMRRQGGGYIVNVGSIGGLIAIPYQPLYRASKLALEGMTESLRLEVVVRHPRGHHRARRHQNRDHSEPQDGGGHCEPASVQFVRRGFEPNGE
jgi:NAD(P)-dependent dehydrogenase (short-subunit alcohol dehydrogenase family)